MVFHLAVVKDDGVGTHVAPIADCKVVCFQDTVFEQMSLEDAVLVEAGEVSDIDEIELYDPCCV